MNQDIPRKGPHSQRIITINRTDPSPDTVMQSDLVAISDLQAQAWQAEQQAQEAVLRIESRIRNGASTEDGEFYFDEHLRMVRTRKKESAG